LAQKNAVNTSEDLCEFAGVDEDSAMAARKVPIKHVDTKPVSAKNGTTAKKPALTAKESTSTHEPTAESLEALAELEAGELTRYVDTADVFKKLGIKVGKA
jgi:hypothetical protein